MDIIVNTLIPVFTVIGLGYLIKRNDWLEDGFWSGAENLAYYLLLPTILFIKIAGADFSNAAAIIPMTAVVLLANVIVVAIIFIWYGVKKPRISDFTAIMQGSIQTNAAYIGLPVALGVFGQQGLIIYAMMLGLVVPVMNTAVLSFLMYYDPQRIKEPFRIFARRVFVNPLVIACLLGLLVSYSGIALPAPIYGIFNTLSNAALPIGLLVVGAALDIQATKGRHMMIFVSSCVKLGLLPLIAIFLAKWVGLAPLEASMAVVYTMLPASAASYLMAKRHHSNATLLAGIIVAETVAAPLTMPLVLIVLGWIFTLPV